MPARTPEEVHALIAAAFDAGDLDAFVELYEEGAALVVPPEGRRVSGRDAIRAAVEPIVRAAPRFRSDVVEKLETDGLALTHARWTRRRRRRRRAVELAAAARSSRAASRTAAGGSCSTTR